MQELLRAVPGACRTCRGIWASIPAAWSSARDELDSVVPLEPATMPGRVVVQWDKEDCADMGIIKVDLLGLGMMAVLEDCLELIPRHYGDAVDLAHLPPDDPRGLRGAAKSRHRGHVPDREPGADVVRCRACARRSFTTSWCRWRSSVPDRSWARWCIRT